MFFIRQGVWFHEQTDFLIIMHTIQNDTTSTCVSIKGDTFWLQSIQADVPIGMPAVSLLLNLIPVSLTDLASALWYIIKYSSMADPFWMTEYPPLTTVTDSQWCATSPKRYLYPFISWKMWPGNQLFLVSVIPCSSSLFLQVSLIPCHFYFCNPEDDWKTLPGS